MKFNKATDNIKLKKFNKPHKNTKIDHTINSVYNIKLYKNVAIYLMKPGTKGNFKFISTLANNGTTPASWTIRISYIKDIWELYFASHPEAEKPEINIYEFLKENFKNIEISGHPYVGIIKNNNKEKIENIINFIILKFSDNPLKINLQSQINKKYTIRISKNKYKVKYKIEETRQTYRKNLLTIDKLSKCPISKKEKKTLMEIFNQLIKDKSLSIKNKEILNEYTDKYMNQRDKIHIAMIYLSETRSKK